MSKILSIECGKSMISDDKGRRGGWDECSYKDTKYFLLVQCTGLCRQISITPRCPTVTQSLCCGEPEPDDPSGARQGDREGHITAPSASNKITPFLT